MMASIAPVAKSMLTSMEIDESLSPPPTLVRHSSPNAVLSGASALGSKVEARDVGRKRTASKGDYRVCQWESSHDGLLGGLRG